MIEELEKIIIQNIETIPNIPLSLFLSGGIDSSLVLALLRKVYPSLLIHTFCLAGSDEYPDIIFAREVANLFKTEHHEVILSTEEYQKYKTNFRKIDRYGLKGDINIYILCFIAKEYSNIILTGDGGDECFGGYWLHKYPLGHKEKGVISSFDEIHPEVRKYIEEMVALGYRDKLFKEKSNTKDYDDVWNYFVECLAAKHLMPLMNITKELNLRTYTPLWSNSIISFMRQLPYTEKIDRKMERELANKYLPLSIINRESIGFDVALK